MTRRIFRTDRTDLVHSLWTFHMFFMLWGRGGDTEPTPLSLGTGVARFISQKKDLRNEWRILPVGG